MSFSTASSLRRRPSGDAAVKPMKFFTKESLKARFSFVLPVSAELIFTLFSALFTALALFSGDGSPVTLATVVLSLLSIAVWVTVGAIAHGYRAKKLLVFQTVFWFAAILVWLVSIPLNGVMTGTGAGVYFLFLALNFPIVSFLPLIGFLNAQNAVLETVLTPIPALALAVFGLILLLRLPKGTEKNGKQTENRKNRSR